MNLLDLSNDSPQMKVMFLKVRAKILDLLLVKVFAKSFGSIWPKYVFKA